MKRDREMTQQTTLNALPIGASGRVTAVNGDSRITRRILEMGIIPGVHVQLVKSAPFDDPIEVSVRGYSLAMRRSEAAAIEVAL